MSFFAMALLAAELVYPFNAGESAQSLERPVEAGKAYLLDFRWREVDVTHRSYVQPYLRAFDSSGKLLMSRAVGMVQQRVFSPDDPSVQIWQVYATPDAGDRYFSLYGAGFEGVSTVRLPSGAVKMRLSLVMNGERCKISDVSFSAQPTGALKSPKCSFPPLKWESKRLTDGELDAYLAKRRRHRARTVRNGTRTEVEIDGVRRPFRIYKNCRWDFPHPYRATKVFAEKGFDVFTFGISLSEVWKADGSVDASPMRAKLRKALKCNPDAFLMVTLGVRPRSGWGADNPDEVFRCESGRYGLFSHGRVIAFSSEPADDPKRKAYAAASYMSEKYAAEASAAIGEFFRQMELWPESKAVVGVYVNGGTDGQWLDLFDNSALPRRESADYSVASQRAFDRFRAARGKAPVPVPSNASYRRRDAVDFGEHRSTPESEWRECYAKASVKMRLSFAKAVKEATGRRMLVGSYSPQTGLAGSALIAQTASFGLIISPDFDFFAVVPGYIREYRDPVIAAVYNATLVRHGKLYVSELDLRSGDVGNWGFYGSAMWRDNHNAATFRTTALQYACHALTMGGTYHAYDMDGGWFNTPEAQETWKTVNDVAAAARAEQPSRDRAAVLFGERFFDHRSQGYGHMLAYAMRELPRHAFAMAGVPCDYYLLDDILADASADLPKVVFFADTSTVTHGRYLELRRRFARDGRVLVWFWRPGVYAEDGAAIDADLAMRRYPGSDNRWIVARSGLDDPLMKGVEGVFTAWYPYYADGVVFPPAYAPDGWKRLASYFGTDDPAVSVRRSKGCTEVHIANPGQIPAEFVRNVAREAGVSVLVESNEICGIGSGIFYMLAQTDGVKRFRLPAGVVPGKTLAGPVPVRDGEGFSVAMRRGEITVVETMQERGKK